MCSQNHHPCPWPFNSAPERRTCRLSLMNWFRNRPKQQDSDGDTDLAQIGLLAKSRVFFADLNEPPWTGITGRRSGFTKIWNIKGTSIV